MAVLSVIDFPSEPEAFDIEGEAGFVIAGVSGDTFANDGHTGLYVKNDTGSPKTVTVAAPRKCSHGFNHAAAIAVPDGFAGFVATEFEIDRFNSPTGVVSLTYSATGLQVAAVRLP